ncbi:MAG: prepilin-type N-terminal cleavage/methylation domain-containing protein [Francisella sp.]
MVTICTNIKNKGFTLIELMVTIAIIAILVAVAIPMYNKYVVRSKLTNVMVISNADDKKIAMYLLEHSGTFGTEAEFSQSTFKAELVANTLPIIASKNVVYIDDTEINIITTIETDNL